MRLRVLSRADVEAALDPDALVDELAAAFAALSAGEASMPPRAGVEVPGDGTVLLMGAHRHGSPSVTVKLVSLYPGHDPAHQAAIVVFDAATGTPAALMDGDAITAARTAAGSRLATRLLAREDADVLAVIGTGVQGEAHLAALAREREWAEVRVWGRRPEAARALAARHDATPVASVGGRRRAARASSASPRRPPSPSSAASGSPPARTSTRSASPPPGRELDPALVRDALVVVESRESALAPPPAGSTDLEGADAHAELGELVGGAKPGRTSPDAADALQVRRRRPRGRRRGRTSPCAGAEERELGRVVEL